jgi:hexosaminidase
MKPFKATFLFVISFLIIFSFNIEHAFCQQTAHTLNLMPVPQKIDVKSGKFRLNNSFNMAVTGNPNQRLYSGATRMLHRLDNKTGLFFSQDVITKENSDASAAFRIGVKRPGKVVLHEDESYQLTITPQRVELSAETDLGALHGLETVLQLLSIDETGYYFPAVSISDTPRFPWRGLLIDVARHFMPVDVIKRNIDGLAAVKMNVMHWHLTDDQGFRIESKTFPKLHQLGSDGMYYTQEQVRDIVQYADERGIRVVPEFDIPGHATSWFVGYPELASAPGPYTIERKFGIKNPTFNPTKEETYQFMDAFFKEITALFPDEYMHIGGDENNGKQWKANTLILEYMKANNIKDNHELQGYFNERILKILTKYNKKIAGWDEILQSGFPKSIVIQSWRGKKSLYKAAEQGYQAILSNGYYIDLAWSTDRHYLNDPIPADAAISDEQKKQILGGEATMWSELVTEETIDSRIWPRTAAIAESYGLQGM